MIRAFRAIVLTAALLGLAAPVTAEKAAPGPLIGKYKGRYSCQGVVIDITLNFQAPGGPGSNIRTGTAQTKGSYIHSDLGKVTEKTDWKVKAVINGHRVDIYETGMTYSTNGGEWLTGFTAETDPNDPWHHVFGRADRCAGGAFVVERK